jgi:aminopeptidase N
MKNVFGLRALVCALAVLAFSGVMAPARADEPYARTRDYDLQNVRVHLRFDLEQRKVMGEADESLVALRDGLRALRFDSVDLTIESVSLNGQPAKFETKPNALLVALDAPAHSGEKFEVSIRYSCQPKKGLYFILPDNNYPDRRKEIWTQGESEDTRYYIPLYDYPNDMTGSEMILTVPRDWLTISNGKLLSVKSEPDGMKTWDWKEPRQHSTYLISIVAGEFAQKKEMWKGMPIEFLVPRGEDETISPTYQDTPQMIDYFAERTGVPYPWEQYATSAVDDFVEGGMENVSATTITTRDLQYPKLRKESSRGADGLLSHELAHQWFGDLVTCKDWGNIWLNESFATYFEHLWTQHHYGKDEADYEFWRESVNWMNARRLFGTPIVSHNFKDAVENSGNVYTKGSWVLHMLDERLGDENFFRGIRRYLEVNRGHNVTTADFAKAIEEATHTNVDRFLDEWVYGAGAPQFEVRSSYDAAAHAVKLEVKQTQKVEGHVGLFTVPIVVEITTASGAKSFPIEISRAEETFTFSVDGPPRMVLFDRENTILKSVDFQKDPAELLYQLKNAQTVPDRADAARALASVKTDDAVAGLGEAALHDPFWGVRAEAIRSLGQIGSPAARKQIETALSNDHPWVRVPAVEELGKFKGEASVASELQKLYREDSAYTVRAAALRSLGEMHAENAFEILQAALRTESPNDVLRAAALRAMGSLGDDRTVPALLAWSAPGKPFPLRSAAISGLGRLDKKNKEITKTLVGYLKEPYFSVRFPLLFALGERGDAEAIPALEALKKSGEINLGFAPFIDAQIARIRNGGQFPGPPGMGGAAPAMNAGARPAGSGGEPAMIMQALEKIQKEIEEMNARMARIEQRLSNEKK